MLKLLTPLLLSSILLAENTPNLTQQIQDMEQEQANMLADFNKIKERRELEEIKAEELEVKAEEERLKLEVKKEEETKLKLERKDALREGRKEKREAERERKAEELRKPVENKNIE